MISFGGGVFVGLVELLCGTLEDVLAELEELLCGTLEEALAKLAELLCGTLEEALVELSELLCESLTELVSDVADDDMYDDTSLSEFPSNRSGTGLQPARRQQARISADIFFI